MGVTKSEGPKVAETGTDPILSKAEEKASPDAAAAIQTANGEPPVEEEPALLNDVAYPSSIRIGAGEYQRDYIVLEAKRDSGLTAAKWNALTAAQRTEYVGKTIERLVAEEKAATEKSSTKNSSDDTAPSAEDVRVHADRGIGGRYVAIGGGERIRVTEASTNGEMDIKPDAELPEEQQA